MMVKDYLLKNIPKSRKKHGYEYSVVHGCISTWTPRRAPGKTGPALQTDQSIYLLVFSALCKILSQSSFLFLLNYFP